MKHPIDGNGVGDLRYVFVLLGFVFSGGVEYDEGCAAHVTVVMSGDDKVGIGQDTTERTVHRYVSASLGHREHGMMHDHDDEASVGGVHRLSEPGHGSCQIDDTHEGVGVDSDETDSRQVDEITGTGYIFGAVEGVRKSMLPNG